MTDMNVNSQSSSEVLRPATNRQHRAYRTAALVAVLALVVAACGGTSGSKVKAADLDSLYSQAKDEGKVIWYAPSPQAQMQPAINAFKKKYPGISVTYANRKAPDLVTQLKVEQAARKVSFDVSNAGGLTVVPSVNLADKVSWATYDVPKDQIFDGKFVYVWAVPKVWAYNTDKIDPKDAPKSWDDVLKPEFSGGKLSIESRGSFMTVWAMDKSMGEKAGLAFDKKLAAQKPHYAPNLTQTAGPILSGESPLGTSWMNVVLAAQDKGAPIGVAPVSPTNANKAYLFVPKAAPHPAAGRLLTAFLASKEGQAKLRSQYNSILPDETDCSEADVNKVIKVLCDAHVKWHGEERSIAQYERFSKFFPQVEKALGTSVN